MKVVQAHFSDGKLTTRIKDPLCRYVLERFVDFGAPKEILTKAKPHIGTDNLRNIVTAIRKRIIELGGEVRFDTALTDLSIANGKVQTISAGDKNEKVSALILAIGHSAKGYFLSFCSAKTSFWSLSRSLLAQE